MNERFLYEVKPLKPIRKMGQKDIRRPFVALLTIDEVKEYMKFGPVYRKYADPNKSMVRVTGENISMLHRDPDNEVKASKVAVADLIPNTDKVEVTEPKKSNVEESTSTDTVVEETSTIENEPIAESEPVTDDNLEETNDGADIVNSEEEVTDETTVDATVVEAETESDQPEAAEEVEAVIEDESETADEATVTEEVTESEDQADAEIDNAEEVVDNENTANNQNKQYNNYNKNKKHKNSNNVQFKQQ